MPMSIEKRMIAAILRARRYTRGGRLELASHAWATVARHRAALEREKLEVAPTERRISLR